MGYKQVSSFPRCLVKLVLSKFHWYSIYFMSVPSPISSGSLASPSFYFFLVFKNKDRPTPHTPRLTDLDRDRSIEFHPYPGLHNPATAWGEMRHLQWSKLLAPSLNASAPLCIIACVGRADAVDCFTAICLDSLGYMSLWGWQWGWQWGLLHSASSACDGAERIHHHHMLVQPCFWVKHTLCMCTMQSYVYLFSNKPLICWMMLKVQIGLQLSVQTFILE